LPLEYTAAERIAQDVATTYPSDHRVKVCPDCGWLLDRAAWRPRSLAVYPLAQHRGPVSLANDVIRQPELPQSTPEQL